MRTVRTPAFVTRSCAAVDLISPAFPEKFNEIRARVCHTRTYFFLLSATAASPAPKSAALLNSMISQATGASLSMIMV